MAIIVTGGAGFIGSNFIINFLNQTQEKVINLDKLTYAGNVQNLASLKNNNNHIFVQGDISDSDLVLKLLKKYRPRCVVNFAAESHVDRSIHKPADFIKTNIVGTFLLLESVRNYWDSLTINERSNFRFIHISTDEVYGSLGQNDLSFTENTRYQPNSPYSASKAAADHLMRAYYNTYGVAVLITNCSNNYGPYQFPEKLIPLIICNAINGKDLPLYGDGKQIRDWLHVDDHCSAILKVIDCGEVGQVYNVGGLNEKSNLEVVLHICNILDDLRPRKDGALYESQIKYIKDRVGHDQRYAINPTKIQQQLGWAPVETFDTGIKKTVKWYLDNSQWIKNISSNEYRAWINKNYN